MIKIEIKNRWSLKVQFTAEIECDESASIGVKLGLALKWAIKTKADLRDAVLRDADLSDADLSGAVLRGADLRGADLRDAVLRDADLSGAVLRGAVLRGADLSGAVLSGAVLRDADLSGAVLRGADLSGAVLRDADLSDAKNMPFVPFIPDLDGKILAALGKEGCKLEMNNWHTCETTHCRAGWAITLAGDSGRTLESMMGPAAAGAIIYATCYPGMKIPNFYADNNEALKDIKSRAALANQAK